METPKSEASEYGNKNDLACAPGTLAAALASAEDPALHLMLLSPPSSCCRTFCSGVGADEVPYAINKVG